MSIRSLVQRLVVLTTLFVAVSWGSSHAAEVTYVGKSGETSFLHQQMKVSAGFYGVQENVIAVTGKGDTERVVKTIQNSDTVAIVISAEALPLLDRASILAVLERHKRKTPVLIGGIDENTDASLLKQWSQGSIVGSKKSNINTAGAFYQISVASDTTYELSGNTSAGSSSRATSEAE